MERTHATMHHCRHCDYNYCTYIAFNILLGGGVGMLAVTMYSYKPERGIKLIKKILGMNKL